MAKKTATFTICTDFTQGCDFLEQVALVIARTINDRDPREAIPNTVAGIIGQGATVASA